MAESVLFDVAVEILKKLGSRGVREIELWWNLKDELNNLRSTMTTIQAVLLDADQKYYSKQSNQLRVWVDKLRETFFDADDLLDDFSTMALRRQVQGGNKFGKEVKLFFSSANPFVYGLKMAHKTKAIRDRFDEIAAERTKFHLVEKHVETSTALAGRDKTHSSLPEVVVGRDEDKKKMIELLFCESYEENVVVIPILGMGGLGKTTLAQLVYNDEEVGKRFGLRLWVCVSDNFDVKLIAEKIVESVTREKSKDLEMNTVKDILLENIKNKKYLLVLDDVWNENMEKWSQLRALLLGGAKGSRVIVTSRLRKVAEITSNILPYELQGLPENHAWSLFEQMAFRRGEGPTSSNMENIGKEILQKCKGVPLAIKTIARLLFFKQGESEWLRFKNEELSKVDQNEDDILPTLKLTYDLLPSHLKQCFAYCSLFPKDYEFEAKRVIDLWKAQGYIANPSSLDKSVEEIGQEYCKDLLWRSFVEVSWRDLLKMHDLMHDLATHMAGSMSTTLSLSNSINIDEKVRHVSFCFDNNVPSYWEAPSSLFKASKLRTILFQGYKRPKITEEQCDAIFSKCRYLRVLDLNDFGMKIVPRSIAKLKHLRYLDLSNNWELKMLPDSVSKLQNLEVLILNWCEKLGILPGDINKLVNLRRLCLRECRQLRYMPRGIGELSGLEELSVFVVGRGKGKGGVGELRGLNFLKGTLEIKNLPHVKREVSEFKEANLKAKQHLEELLFSWEDGSPQHNVAESEALEDLQPHQNLKKLSITNYHGLKFPRWISSLSNLKSITIRDCHGFAHLTPLHDLTSLIELEIYRLDNLEYIHSNEFNGNSGLLQSLGTLSLSDCPNLKRWWPPSSSTTYESLPHFHCLSTLTVRNCPRLTSMPQFPPLQTMELGYVSRDLLVDIFKIEVEDSSSSHPDQEAKSVFRVPEESWEKFSSLKEFHMCDNWGKEIIIQASHGNHLTSLERLCIRDCEDLNMCDVEEGMFWGGLPFLNDLTIQNASKLCCLPDGIQSLPNLYFLGIIDCPNLKSLPEWMANTSLSWLRIWRCQELSERCRDKDSADWHLIAHIPTITIDGSYVQQNGVYKL